MEKPDDLAEQLIDLSLELVCNLGLENYSIRNVAAAANCSNTPITSRFKNKSGLIRAVQRRAFALDSEFHNQLAQQLVGMPINSATLTTFLRSYLQQRSKLNTARFWSEVIAKFDQGLSSRAEIQRWHDMRIDFWQQILARSDIPYHPQFAETLCCYLFMEEFYIYELADDLNYQLLMDESIKALLSGSFDAEPESRRGEVIRWLNKNSAQFPDFEPHERSELANRLLDLAGDAIRKKGLNALSLRTLTTKAGVSSAAIAYHFGNMANFSNEALWHVLLRELPAQFDPTKVPERQRDIKEWADYLRVLTRSADEGKPPGFYNEYSRLTGQACLLARQDHLLHPLINHLRQIDGWGTYRAGNAFWPAQFSVDRGNATTFGIWIKGRSMLQEAISDQALIPAEEFINAAEILLQPTAKSEPQQAASDL